MWDIIGKRREDELAPHNLQSAQKEGALVHQLLDRAQGVLDARAALIEDLETGSEPRVHVIKEGLVH